MTNLKLLAKPASVLLAGAMLAACGQGSSQSLLASDLAALGACPDEHIDLLGTHEFVPLEGEWAVVEAFDGAKDDGRASDAVGRFKEVRSAGQEGSAVLTKVRTSKQLAGDLAAATELGAEIYLRVSSFEQDAVPPPTVRYGLAFIRDDFAFMGLCARRVATAPFTRQYGPAAAASARALVGASQAELAAAVAWAEPSPPPPPAEPVLGVDVPAEGLALVSVRLDPVPERWIGPYTICPRITRGWSTCFDLSVARRAKFLGEAYVDPSDPSLEFWLADAGADLASPHGLLGSVDLRDAASGGGLDLSVLVTVELNPAHGSDDVARGAPGEPVTRISVSRGHVDK